MSDGEKKWMEPEEAEEEGRPPEDDDAPPDDEEVMLTLGSSHDSVTDFDTLLDETADEDDEL
ncbi:MAG: hypothetical protein M3220_15985 [Chloroflexota bacterium]|nr:hypothetical protein [Chloroflexota bacterium]